MPFREWFPHNPAVAPLARDIELLTASIKHLEKRIMSALDDLTAKVAAVKTVEDSAVTLIQGLRDQLAAIATAPTPQQIQDIITQLDANTTPLANAVAQGTSAPTAPAAPTA